MSWKRTNLERARILELYLKSGSIIQSQRDYKRIYKVRKCPSKREIIHYAKIFRESASAQSLPGPGRPRNARTPENIATVHDDVMQSPDRSTQKIITSIKHKENISQKNIEK